MPQLAALLAATALAACAAPPPEAEEVFVRLHNASPYRLEDIRVTFYARVPVAYGRLEPGQTSDYRLAAGAYSYARIEALVDGRPYTLQPIDFVGETQLRPGRYTYRLVPWPGQRGFTIDGAVRDY